MKLRTSTRLLATGISLALLSGLAAAEDSNEVKYRKSVMNAMGSSFGALAMVFTNRVKQPDALAVHAEALAVSSTQTAALFPEGSEGGKALPIIWEEPDKFAAAAKLMEESSAALAEAAKSGDRAATAQAFKAAGEACKGCHERYKEEDE